MKVVLLAGGLGTRIAEETEIKPKPMVEIGGYPILWHVMKIFGSQGFNEFFVALGYKGDYIKRYFLDYYNFSGNISIDFATGKTEFSDKEHEDWKINLIDTGAESMTGGRVKRLQPFLKDSTFMVTYGDGVGDIDLKKLLEFHKSNGKLATVTAVRPPARYGELLFNEDDTVNFKEKPEAKENWINGGFMVFEPKVFEYLRDDSSILEKQALEKLSEEGQLAGYKHNGSWQCADTLHDKRLLENLWKTENAPWKIW